MKKLETKVDKGIRKRSTRALAEGREPEDVLFAVTDSELRRLLRLSNVQAYHDCRRRPLPWIQTQLEESP